MNEQALERLFPKLKGEKYMIASPYDDRYNCIAFAAEDPDPRWWWPDESQEYYWPRNVPREETLEAFVAAFATLGFQTVVDSKLDPGFKKIAIYANKGNVPTHAARQLSNGMWASKLGKYEDIIHSTPEGLEDASDDTCVYGSVAIILRRPV